MNFFKRLFGRESPKVDEKRIYNIICPHCFEEFEPEEAVFRASHHSDEDEDFMLQEDEVLNRFRRMFQMAELGEMECVIKSEDVPEENKKRVDGGVLIEVVDKLGVKTDKRLCPYCHNILPSSAGRAPSNIISFVGASQVGKTVYMTSLIHMLQNETARNFDAACMPIDINDYRKFKEDYETPLFENGILLDPTQKEKRMEPFIFELTFKDRSRPPLTLVFFDIAGEGTTDPEYLELKAKHIRKSVGILFLVDPLQIKTIRDKISLQKGDNPGEFTSEYDEARDVFIALYQKFFSKNDYGRTDVPVAIILTKSDMLRLLNDEEYFRENSNVFRNYIHREYFNFNEFENINGEVGRFFDKVDRPFKDALDIYFTNSAYFAVSAIGSNPVNQRVQGIVEPLRVDEPLLWILNKLNIIEGR
ncbi:MAG: hypothetical protein ABFD25_03185 [Clostridiaceae bacterium]